MSGGRRGLGRGLGALIGPAAPADGGAVRPAASPAPTSVVATGATSPASVPVLPGGRGTVAARAAAGKRAIEQPQADQPVAAPVAGAFFAELPLDSITPNPRQPREVFDEDKLAELVVSIREVGLLQPVVVRQTGPDGFELIMGERRWRASREAGLTLIPAIVRATEDDKLLLDALLENLHRAELNALEEAAAYEQLLHDFSCTHDELADRIGRSRTHVTNTLRLLKLAPTVQRRIAAGTLTAGHAKALAGIPDAERQEELAKRIIAEGLSVRTTEEIVKLMGSEAKPKRQTPKAGKLITPAFNELADRLSDRFDTRVKVEVSQRGGKLGKGKVVLEFGSVDDLNRILDSLAPGEDGLRLSQG
ncbi:ParB/RepB/Spo0J family partition protein [Streptomyces rubellomurinus]|uniref:Plasmid partitioning protein ParB n=2 Tax=Streptomyces TaxID=1883 RepID=A0A0F2TEF6_STRR3|nr:ParB/RepB/Spo0J family partition protein [Streptomyces rubellomurinus]KJS56044.1 plasmid partitioning protein ParB [Streptomyces rubellomurinus subsp. indigoferus]KJS60685.1 plasmid partitioning protein ParB [Streptomyces rubellomurinus]